MGYRTAILFLAFTLLAVGCDSSGDDSSDDSCMSATVDGERFSVDQCDAGYQTRFTNIGTLSLTGGTFTEDGEGIKLLIYTADRVDRGDTGTYVTTGRGITAEIATTYYTDRGFGANNNFLAPEGEGTITIESYTEDQITGSFEFEGVANDGTAVSVTDGSFDIATPD
ncbi:MAG: hypothetical protein BRD37_01475 [Bacteroidetes bacterium QH_8_67_23]|nr:MAG: hypothetical protein BRD37_01475 [Bacteroidetes bacterium QH_8_67_23]